MACFASDTRIKRPMNAFMIWAQRMRPVIAKRYAGNVEKVDNAQISRILGSLWKNLAKEEKNMYAEAGDKAKLAHKLAFPDYKYQPKPPRKHRKVPESLKLLPTKALPSRPVAPTARSINHPCASERFIVNRQSLVKTESHGSSHQRALKLLLLPKATTVIPPSKRQFDDINSIDVIDRSIAVNGRLVEFDVKYHHTPLPHHIVPALEGHGGITDANVDFQHNFGYNVICDPFMGFLNDRSIASAGLSMTPSHDARSKSSFGVCSIDQLESPVEPFEENPIDPAMVSSYFDILALVEGDCTTLNAWRQLSTSDEQSHFETLFQMAEDEQNEKFSLFPGTGTGIDETHEHPVPVAMFGPPLTVEQALSLANSMQAMQWLVTDSNKPSFSPMDQDIFPEILSESPLLLNQVGPMFFSLEEAIV